MTQMQPDPRYGIVNPVVETFEQTEAINVADDARLYLLTEILIEPKEFENALQSGKIKVEDVRKPVEKLLTRAKQLSIEKGMDFISEDAVKQASHDVIEAQLGCPWPFIIC